MPSSRALALASLAVAALAAAGCGGSGGAGSLPYICPETPSSVVASGALVSPANGATGVSPSIGRITFTVSSPDLQGTTSQTAVTLTPVGGGAPLTQPDSVITTNGLSSSVIPPLHGATTYTVTVRAAPTLPGGCPGSVSAALGSFTTQ
jgi:hypothetical protein